MLAKGSRLRLPVGRGLAWIRTAASHVCALRSARRRPGAGAERGCASEPTGAARVRATVTSQRT
eukprot:scaffold1973_cov399-Prasinococcus_capsulatus_cf.AAC.12